MEKLVKPGTNLRFIPKEEMFDVIHTVHIEKGHPGRDIMQRHMTQHYANVTTDFTTIYRNLCLTCGLKKVKSQRGAVWL